VNLVPLCASPNKAFWLWGSAIGLFGAVCGPFESEIGFLVPAGVNRTHLEENSLSGLVSWDNRPM